MKMIARFWQDEAGFVVSSELVLLATIVVLGLTTGMASLRNGVVQELEDLAQTFGAVNQTYSFSGVTGHFSSTAGSFRLDETDQCDVNADTPATEPGCMLIQAAATAE